MVQLKPYICEKICEYVRYYFGTQDGWEKEAVKQLTNLTAIL